MNQRYNGSDSNDSGDACCERSQNANEDLSQHMRTGANMETRTKSQEVGLQQSRGPARAANLLADPDVTLRDKEARMLNIRSITVCANIACEGAVLVSFVNMQRQ